MKVIKNTLTKTQTDHSKLIKWNKENNNKIIN